MAQEALEKMIRNFAVMSFAIFTAAVAAALVYLVIAVVDLVGRPALTVLRWPFLNP
jgi:hypothetical protein